MNWGNVIVRKISTDPDGTVKDIIADLNLAGDPSSTDYKLHWVGCDAASVAAIPRSMPEPARPTAATAPAAPPKGGKESKLPLKMALHSTPTIVMRRACSRRH